MNIENLSLISGAISSLIFVGSYFPMLRKAYRSKDLHSYSLLNLILVNGGNLIYWLYVIDLPLGPVWILHTFYTLSSGLLLVWYCQFQLGQSIRKSIGSWSNVFRSVFAVRCRSARQLHHSC